MATTVALLASAAAAAAASAGGSAIASHQQSQAAKSAGFGGKRVWLPGYASAINREVARATALNMDKVPPSFGQYVQSGGTALFPWQSPGISPVEARKLGLIDKTGGAISMLTPQQAQAGQLTPDQLMFLSQWERRRGHTKAANQTRDKANRAGAK